MELTAVIRALEAVSPDSRAVVLCDSQYVVRGITDWIHNWKRRNWRTAGRRPVKNADLWKRLDTIRQRRPGVRFQWVRGHAGHPGNELAHETALREAMRRRRRGGTRSGDEGGPAHAGGSLFAASRPRG